MTFNEALKLRQSIRRKHWAKDNSIDITDYSVRLDMTANDVIADDWEVYEEPAKEPRVFKDAVTVETSSSITGSIYKEELVRRSTLVEQLPGWKVLNRKAIETVLKRYYVARNSNYLMEDVLKELGFE